MLTPLSRVTGRDAWVELAVTRDAEFADMPATVVYATSDLSAQGVSTRWMHHLTASESVSKDRMGK